MKTKKMKRIIVDIDLLRGAAQVLSDIIIADEGGEPYTGEGLSFAVDSYNDLTALVSKAEEGGTNED